jgi:hypothetical protein
MQPKPNSSPSAPRPPSPGEALWRNVFFYLSALMAALAMVDLDAGRVAHAMGDGGVACLMLSLLNQFPFVRAMVSSGVRDGSPKSRGDLLREAERLRAAHPWSDRLGAAGWMLMLASLVLRAFGVA